VITFVYTINIYDMAMKLNTYRLTSLEEPTEEQLHALMEQVAIAARESSRRAKIEMERRMQEIVQIVLKRKEGKN
jgi:hypothetical protein